ncbi:MAG: hypothetical protein ACI9WT_002382, partial [Flavobacterium sp.]
ELFLLILESFLISERGIKIYTFAKKNLDYSY